MRPLTVADLPWIHRLFKQRYPKGYDWHTSEVWFRNTVLNSPLNIYAARTDDAFIIALLSVMPWLPSFPEVQVFTVCADGNQPWQAIRLVRASIAWAKLRNAAVWKISSDTEYDLTPLARRVGAHEIHTRFALDLRGEAHDEPPDQHDRSDPKRNGKHRDAG